MKQKMTLLMLVLIAALVSCNKESEFDNSELDKGKGKVAADFSTQIQTKAIGNSWSANDKIGVFMINEGKHLSTENIVNGAENIAYQTVA